MKDRLFKSAKCTFIAACLTGLTSLSVQAQDVTLRLHQFLPPYAAVPSKVLQPWADTVSEATDGRLEIQRFDGMALGGRPNQLMDQARDGVVDIVLTVAGYTPGRFPRTEVFELPFMMTDSISTSLAFQQMVEDEFQETEYKDVKVLGAWVHGPGVIHTGDQIASLEDIQGAKLRGPTRVINDLLSELGASPVGMPIPAIPEALSKGVIDGTVLPWEVAPSIRLSELVTNHTEFAGDRSLYTTAILLVMNKARYDSLPDDLRAALDAESGAKLSALAAKVMSEADIPGRDIAVKSENNIVVLDEQEVARWKDAAQPVVDRWVSEMGEKDIDGADLIERAQAMIAKKSM